MNRITKIGLSLAQRLKLDRVLLSLARKNGINKFLLKHCWQHKGYKHFYKRYLAWQEIFSENKIDLSEKIILEVGAGASVGLGYFFLKQGFKLWLASDFFQDLTADKKATRREKKLVKHVAAKYDPAILCQVKFANNRIIFGQRLNFCKLDVAQLNPAWTGNLDLILSVEVLEHLSAAEMTKAVANLSAYLKPGGLMIHNIDFRDHVNPANPFGFLHYSPSEWEKSTKGGIFYTNRLRLDDYLAIFSRYGLKVRWLKTKKMSLNKKIKIDEAFNKYTTEDLEIIRAFIVLEKIS
jgi:hypothetical protein